MRRASPPSGRIRYNWFRLLALSGASRFDRKKNSRLSCDHAGDDSFFSFVNVICFVDDTPCCSETRYTSVWRLASFQSGDDSV